MFIKKLGLHKDMRGLADMTLIVVILAVVGIGGFAVWRVTSYNNNKDADGKALNDGSGRNTATLSDECVQATGDENICRLGSIATDLSQFASEIKGTWNGDNIVMRYDGKGNMEMEGFVEGKTVGGRNYVYIFDGWYDTTGDSAHQAQTVPMDFGFATTAGIKYENLGKEACGDHTCFHYRMTGGLLGDGVVECWFSDKDYLPRKCVATGGLTGRMSLDIEYRDDITISAPEGAKPVSEVGSSLLD